MLLDAHVGGMWETLGEGKEERRTQELNFSCRSRDCDATMNGSSNRIQREYSTVCRYFSSATSLNTFVQTKKMHISFNTDSKDQKPQGDVPAIVFVDTHDRHNTWSTNDASTHIDLFQHFYYHSNASTQDCHLTRGRWALKAGQHGPDTYRVCFFFFFPFCLLY